MILLSTPWPDWIDDLTIGALLTPLLGVFVPATVGVTYSKWIHPIARRVVDFLDDWQGRPARPGHDAEPGFPSRVYDLEVQVAEIQANVKPNHGTSAHDKLSREIADLRDEIHEWIARPPT